jgi:VIT1/CCC1 family predicted Fe2+/Mn2+ transporter
MPLLMSAFVPVADLTPAVAVSSLLFLAVLGALAARVGGAALVPAAVRVLFWGAMAMAVTAGVGWLFGTVV